MSTGERRGISDALRRVLSSYFHVMCFVPVVAQPIWGKDLVIIE